MPMLRFAPSAIYKKQPMFIEEVPMPRKSDYRKIISINNQELLNSKVFTEACGGSLPVLAIICEHTLDCGFIDLIGLYEDEPQMVERMCDRARSALRGLKKLEKHRKLSKQG
jgi:hypothetical protein